MLWTQKANLNDLNRSGLPQSASGYLDSDSDDELDDEEDEDSNGKFGLTLDSLELVDLIASLAEDFYKNDYPDEESDSDWDSFSDKDSDDSGMSFRTSTTWT